MGKYKDQSDVHSNVTGGNGQMLKWTMAKIKEILHFFTLSLLFISLKKIIYLKLFSSQANKKKKICISETPLTPLIP